MSLWSGFSSVYWRTDFSIFVQWDKQTELLSKLVYFFTFLFFLLLKDLLFLCHYFNLSLYTKIFVEIFESWILTRDCFPNICWKLYYEVVDCSLKCSHEVISLCITSLSLSLCCSSYSVLALPLGCYTELKLCLWRVLLTHLQNTRYPWKRSNVQRSGIHFTTWKTKSSAYVMHITCCQKAKKEMIAFEYNAFFSNSPVCMKLDSAGHSYRINKSTIFMCSWHSIQIR